MDPAKLRALMYAKDKLKSQGLGMPVNKSAPKPMSPGLPNPMGMAPNVPKPPSMGLPKPTAAPSLPQMPKQPKFAKVKKALKSTKEF